MDVDALKRDGGALFAELGVDYAPGKKKYLCTYHHEKTPSLNIRQDENGIWVFKCFGCGHGGTIIDAIAYNDNKDPKIVYGEIKRANEFRKPYKKIDVPTRTYAIPRRPVLDLHRAIEFVERSNRELRDNYDQINAQYRRGISAHIIEKYQLGFRRKGRFRDAPDEDCRFDNCWVLPITDREGKLGGIKIHREKPIEWGSKCSWATFGTMPERNRDLDIEPLHSYYDFWPAPEWLEPEKYENVFLCAGELKALSMLSIGLKSCAFSGGESFNWTPEMVARFTGFNVVILYDDDKDKISPQGKISNPGHAFRNKAAQALMNAARKIKVMTFGRAEDYLGLTFG